MTDLEVCLLPPPVFSLPSNGDDEVLLLSKMMKLRKRDEVL